MSAIATGGSRNTQYFAHSRRSAPCYDMWLHLAHTTMATERADIRLLDRILLRAWLGFVAIAFFPLAKRSCGRFGYETCQNKTCNPNYLAFTSRSLGCAMLVLDGKFVNRRSQILIGRGRSRTNVSIRMVSFGDHLLRNFGKRVSHQVVVFGNFRWGVSAYRI